jgi:hypothetical protein
MLRTTIAILALAMLSGCSKGGSAPTNPGGGGATNHNPTVSVNTSTTHLAYGGGATITVTASDPDGDQLTFAFAGAGGTVSASGPTATTASFTAGTQWGPASVTVTVTDGRGGSSQATATMYVRNPAPPRLCLNRGTPCTTSYNMTLTPDEAIVVTEIAAKNLYDSGCFPIVNYASPGLAIAASQTHEFTDVGCLECTSSANAAISDWAVDIFGRRAEPDGGTFHVQLGYNPTDAIRQPKCTP